MEIIRKGALALIVAVTTAAMAIPALANGGAPPRYDRQSYPSIWQGLYAGVHLGHGESGPADGFVGGAQIGYNWQSGQVVWGLEADVSFADISVEQNFLGVSVSGSIDWLATARGRLGYLVMPNILVYGTAGFGIASGSGSASILDFRISGSDSETDFVFGLGLEGKFTDTMSARIEYLSFSDLEIDIILAGVNFRFGN